jgi:hypothetical protein
MPANVKKIRQCNLIAGRNGFKLTITLTLLSLTTVSPVVHLRPRCADVKVLGLCLAELATEARKTPEHELKQRMGQVDFP